LVGCVLIRQQVQRGMMAHADHHHHHQSCLCFLLALIRKTLPEPQRLHASEECDL
jgi:hypothetical protein